MAAAIRIQFPGEPQVRVIALTGARITIGRSPDNTVQILDRSISAHHAELIEDGSHYRLHDLTSTNGVFVKGQQVTDFHLTETCTLGFGTFRCEFLLAGSADENGPVETLPSRSEVKVLQTENSRLQEEIARSARDADAAREQATVLTALREQHDKLLAEHRNRESTRESEGNELAALRLEVAQLRTQREELQRSLESRTAASPTATNPEELERLRQENNALKLRIEEQTRSTDEQHRASAAQRDALAATAAERDAMAAEHKRLLEANAARGAAAADLRAELASVHAENTRLKAHREAQEREIVSLRRANAELSDETGRLVTGQMYGQVEAERNAATEAQTRLKEQLESLGTELAARTLERDTLQSTIDSQKSEIESLPKPAELETLRAENAELLARCKTLQDVSESLRARQSAQSAELALRVPREEYDKLLTAHSALKEAAQRHQSALPELERRLAAVQARVVELERTLALREGELDRLRISRPPQNGIPAALSGAPQQPPHPPAELATEQEVSDNPGKLEDALERMGFVIRRIKPDATDATKT